MKTYSHETYLRGMANLSEVEDNAYAWILAERDQLRAELAAAKNLLARIHRDGGHHTEAVGFAQSVADAGDKVSEWLLAAEEKMQEGEGDCRFCRDLEGDSNYPCTCGWTYGALATAYGNALQERTALAAHVERLEKALKPFADRIKQYPPWMWTAMVEREKQGIITGGFRVGGEAVTHMPAMLLVQAEEALAATAAHSLAAHDAAVKVAVLREVARHLDKADFEWLMAEADRIAKEAPHA